VRAIPPIPFVSSSIELVEMRPSRHVAHRYLDCVLDKLELRSIRTGNGWAQRVHLRHRSF